MAWHPNQLYCINIVNYTDFGYTGNRREQKIINRTKLIWFAKWGLAADSLCRNLSAILPVLNSSPMQKFWSRKLAMQDFLQYSIHFSFHTNSLQFLDWRHITFECITNKFMITLLSYEVRQVYAYNNTYYCSFRLP